MVFTAEVLWGMGMKTGEAAKALAVGVALASLAAVAHAEVYAVIAQDTHIMELIEITSIVSPSASVRQFNAVSISAWPELWQDSYGQMSESRLELDCGKHQITFRHGSVTRDIRGDELGVSLGEDITRPISDGYAAYEQYVCEGRAGVAQTPFRDLEAAKRYYFTWLNRTVPTITAK